MSDPLQTQVGGSHYKRLEYQPLEFILDAKLDFVTGNIVKYIARYPHKNGVVDLKKALHYVQFMSQYKPKKVRVGFFRYKKETTPVKHWLNFINQEFIDLKQMSLLLKVSRGLYGGEFTRLAEAIEKEIELLS